MNSSCGKFFALLLKKPVNLFYYYKITIYLLLGIVHCTMAQIPLVNQAYVSGCDCDCVSVNHTYLTSHTAPHIPLCVVEKSIFLNNFLSYKMCSPIIN